MPEKQPWSWNVGHIGRDPIQVDPEEMKKAVEQYVNQKINLLHPSGDVEPVDQTRSTGMYERFTDRARKVMQLANQEAQRFNHEYIGTEHVLLGLVKEGSGIAANVLKNLDIDLRKIRIGIEKLVHSGPDIMTMGKMPLTPNSKKLIEFAIEEARTLEHQYVGSEHLLLGCLRVEDGIAAQVLISLGLNLEDVREELKMLLGIKVTAVGPDESEHPVPEAVTRAIATAVRIAAEHKAKKEESEESMSTILLHQILSRLDTIIALLTAKDKGVGAEVDEAAKIDLQVWKAYVDRVRKNVTAAQEMPETKSPQPATTPEGPEDCIEKQPEPRRGREWL